MDGGMIGEKGLDDHFAGEFGSAGAACDLREELEDLFGRAEIGDAERGVGIEDADEGDGGKMKSFGDHLGADEHIGFVGAELFEEIFVAVFFCVVSRSIRRVRTSGKMAWRDRSTCSVPNPLNWSDSEHWQLGTGAGSGLFVIAEMALEESSLLGER